MKSAICVLAALACMCFMPLSAGAVVIDFEDLDYETTLTGTNYAGLIWEQGSAGYDGKIGFWSTGTTDSSYPESGTKNVLNAWGCPFIGVGFGQLVNVQGAFFAAQGDAGSPTTGVRVHGYRNGVETGVTSWFNDIDVRPDWFQIGLNNVDRVVFESKPRPDGGGWYGLDDFTYEPVPEPSSILALAGGVMAIGGMLRRRRNY